MTNFGNEHDTYTPRQEVVTELLITRNSETFTMNNNNKR